MSKSISKEELSELPVESFAGEIFVIDYPGDIKKVTPYLKRQSVLGFDTETRPAFTKGVTYKVALLQLATPNKAFLFRIGKTGLPPELADILADPNITKVGVAINDDIKALKNITRFKPDGFVEIQEKVKEYAIENFGLKKLSGLLLGFRISKAQQTSNWEAETLSEPQLLYAATDAWVSLLIYQKLLTLEKVPLTE